MEDLYEDQKNIIHSSAIVSPNCIIGNGNYIGPYAVIEDNVILGNNNWIGPLVTIGQPGEYKNPPEGFDVSKGKVKIGNGNTIREHTAIQASVMTNSTIIGDNNFIMEKCHIAHDCVIGDNVIIAPLTSLGGSVCIENDSNLGQGVIIHPRLKIGRGSMLGMNSTITKDIPEFETWAGCPAKYLRPNYKMIEKLKNIE